MDLSFDAASFSGWAPLFPLTGVVLLPGALLPLHIFEPRYREMTKDALEGEKLIAMALLKEEEGEDGAPAIHEWVGLGRIVAHAGLKDGRSNLVLAGLRRARVVDEDRSRAYRRGKLEVHEDEDGGVSEATLEQCREQVSQLLARLPEELVRDSVRLGVARKIGVPLGPLLDLAADAIALEPEEKQVLLSEPRVRERAVKLVDLVAQRSAVLKPRPLSWPFSKN